MRYILLLLLVAIMIGCQSEAEDKPPPVTYPEFEWRGEGLDYTTPKAQFADAIATLKYIDEQLYLLDKKLWQWGARNDMERAAYIKLRNQTLEQIRILSIMMEVDDNE